MTTRLYSIDVDVENPLQRIGRLKMKHRRTIQFTDAVHASDFAEKVHADPRMRVIKSRTSEVYDNASEAFDALITLTNSMDATTQ